MRDLKADDSTFDSAEAFGTEAAMVAQTMGET